MKRIRTYSRPYVGLERMSNIREVFRYVGAPTALTHGDRYITVMGPFRSMRGAQYVALFGTTTPPIRSVREAERMASVRDVT